MGKEGRRKGKGKEGKRKKGKWTGKGRNESSKEGSVHQQTQILTQSLESIISHFVGSLAKLYLAAWIL